MAEHDDLGFIPDKTPSPSDDHSDLGFTPDAPEQSLFAKLLNQYDSGKKALLASAIQGASGGWADEAGGMAGALGEKALESTGLKQDSGKSVHDLYRQYQQNLQNKYQDMQKEHPAITALGSLGGSAASMALLPETQLSKVPSALERVGAVAKSAATMAGLGAASDAGGSTNNLDNNPSGLANDVEQGGIIGGLVGGGGNALKQGATTLSTALSNSDSPFVRQAMKSFQMGEQGLGFGGDKNRNRVLQQTSNVASDITKNLNTGFDSINDKYAQILDQYKNPIKFEAKPLQPISDIQDAIQNGDITLPKSTTNELSDGLNKLTNGSATANDAKDIQKTLYQLSGKVDPAMSSSFNDAATNIGKTLEDQVPGYKAINDSFRNARTIPESVISKAPENMNETYLSDMSKPTQGTYQGFKNVIQNSQTNGATGRPSKEAFINLQNTLNNLKATDPNTLKTLNIDPDTIMSQIKNQGDIDSIWQAISGNQSHNGVISQLLGGQTVKGAVYNASNFLGKVSGKLSPTEAGRALYNAPPEQLSSVATALKNNPTTAHLGESLGDSITSNNPDKKNTALFCILQNPDAKKAIGLGPEDQNKYGGQ